MAYREVDGDLVREYANEECPIVTYQTEKAVLDLVPSNEYGSMIFLDNVLQFASKDEYIYHEMLVHPCLSSSQSRKNICIIGGGDGCALREVLKWPEVEHVDLIDWDSQLTTLFSTQYSYYNTWAMQDSRVHVENRDIQSYAEELRSYDCILVDLLDPDEGQAELWEIILSCAHRWIRPGGSIVINAGGITPWDTDTFNWLLQHVQTTPAYRRHAYKVFVPSFAKEWCFLLLNQTKDIELSTLPKDLHYLDTTAWKKAYTYGWTKDYLNRIHGLL